jgi:hypothetical protein
MTSPETLELEAIDNALAGRYVAPEHAELAELALLLRDDRPEPRPVWATQLDRRLENGFPRLPRKRRRTPVWIRQAAPVVAVFAVVTAIALPAALLSDGSDDSGGGGGDSSASYAEPASGGGGDDSGGGEASGAGVAQDEAASPDNPVFRANVKPQSDRADRRKVERRVDMRLAAPRRQIDRVATEIGDVAANLGGFVRRSRVSSASGGDLQLRVPTNQLDLAVQRLSKLAKVRELTRSADDITGAYVSVRDRLAELRAERKSLLTQLANATTLNETESIRARLDIVNDEIVAARNSLRRVNNRANFANVNVALVPTRSGEDDEEGGAWTPGDAWHDAVRVLEVIAGVLVIALAIAVPLLIAWLLGWLGRRGVTRRRRERALDMA